MLNLVKVLITFTCLLSICCFFVSSQNIPSQDISSQEISSRDILSRNVLSQNISSQDILYIYEEPLEGLIFYNTYANYDTLIIWMVFEDKEDPSCILPYVYLRLIEKTGLIKYIDVNYTFPVESVCPINIQIIPLTYNYIMIVYVKSNNGVKEKYGLIINYSSEIINEIYLGSVNEHIMRSILSEKGFIRFGELDKKGIATWHWYSSPDIATGEVVELGSGQFCAPNLSSYTFVNSLKFILIDGGFGYVYILKYDETKGSLAIKDPNIQYWRIYVSFLREGTYLPTIPSLVYQTTTKLNNIIIKSCSPAYNDGLGYMCIMSLNNTITNKKKKSRTKINYYQLGFLSTGAFVRLDIFPNLISPTGFDLFNLESLIYGGLLVEKYYVNTTAMDFYILDDSRSYVHPGGSFGPEFNHYNRFRRNNTIFGIKKQTGNKLEILLKPLLKINGRGTEYDNPLIESTKPAINEVIDPSVEEITIKFAMPVKLSTANISIFQLNDDPYKPHLLRQTFSGDSKLCTIGSDNYTVHIPIFKSTFNQPNSSYYVVVENNFVISQARDEPLLGIKEKTWTFSTDSFKTGQHSDSVTGLLRLNEEGSSKFIQTPNQLEFFKIMIQEFSKIIPAKDTIEPSSQTIFDNLRTLIEKKGFTALSNNEYTSLIDESASFTIIQNYFEKFSSVIIIFIVSLIVLIALYFLARRKNPEGKNSAIFETAFIIQDFAMDLAVTLLKVKSTPHLITLNMIFFVVPIIINCLLGLYIFISEIKMNPSFVTWFLEFPALSSICTLFSAVDLLVLNTLSSNLFGLKIFSAPLTQRSRKIILWGSFINILIEDVPQLIIQGIYFNSIITYDLIPSLALASGGLAIGNKLILRSYHALVRWYHRRNKIRDINKQSHLSVASFRSVKSNVENLNIERKNYNNNEEEEEIDLTEIFESIGRDHRTTDFDL